MQQGRVLGVWDPATGSIPRLPGEARVGLGGGTLRCCVARDHPASPGGGLRRSRGRRSPAWVTTRGRVRSGPWDS